MHVLHLSGHGGPGVLDLEDDDGDVREITAAEFLDEAIPAECMPPVISLAACYTNVPPGAKPGRRRGDFVRPRSSGSRRLRGDRNRDIGDRRLRHQIVRPRLRRARHLHVLRTRSLQSEMLGGSYSVSWQGRAISGTSSWLGSMSWGVVTVLAAAPQVLVLVAN